MRWGVGGVVGGYRVRRCLDAGWVGGRARTSFGVDGVWPVAVVKAAVRGGQGVGRVGKGLDMTYFCVGTVEDGYTA